jgi:hypothetical protein
MTRIRTHSPEIPLDGLDKHLGDMSRAERVLEANMGSTAIDEVGLSQLVDVPKVLEARVIDHRYLVTTQSDEAVHGQEELLPTASVGSGVGP